MTHDPEQHDPADDFWQAYLYLSDEMSREEAALFEARLQNSPELCDTLSEVSRLDSSLQVLGYSALDFDMADSLNKSRSLANAKPGTIKISEVSPKNKGFRFKSTLQFALITTSVMITFVICMYSFTGMFRQELMVNREDNSSQDLLQNISVQQMSGMLGVWLKPTTMDNPPSEATAVEQGHRVPSPKEQITSLYAELEEESLISELLALDSSATSVSQESSLTSEVPEWLIVALQVEAEDSAKTPEI